MLTRSFLSHLRAFAALIATCFLAVATVQAANPIKLYMTHGSATSTADRLDRADIDGANLSSLASDSGNFTQPESIQIDYASGHIFMVDSTGKQILRFNLDGTGRTLIFTITHTGLPRGLALDRDNQKIYFTTGSATSADDRLTRINYDGTGEVTLASGAVSNSDLVMQPLGLAIDTERGFLYVGDNFANQTTNLGIVRFNLDGSGRTQIVSEQNATFGGALAIMTYMTVDESTGQLYFCTGSATTSNDRVMRVNPDGSGLTIIYSDAANFNQPLGIAVDKANGFLFVGDSALTGPAPFYRFNLDGSGGRIQVGLGYANSSVANGLSLYSTAPTISDVTDQTLTVGASTGNLAVTVGDTAGETPAGSLLLYAKSSNQTLVPNGNIVLGGSGASRTVNVTGAPGQTGTATITLTVNDGARIARDTFNVTFSVPSNNANLSALSFSAGTISPAFAAGTTSYSFSVANGTTSTTVTATKADANATLQVQVNGGGFSALTSGSPSGSLALNVGANTVDVKVTAQDGTTIKTYSTTITRAASSNADLSAMSFSAGSISPAFAAGTTAYSFSVANGTTSTTVTATRADATATLQVQVNGGGFTALTSGTPSSALSLNVGANTVDVKVTAQNGTTTKTYTTTITRAASSNADLSALSFSAGSISPAFAAGTTAYSFSVANGTTSTTVTATRADAGATLQVQINGGGFTALTSGTPSSALSLNVGANTVDVKVTAQDGSTIKTYTTTITRAASSNADLSALSFSAGSISPAFAAGTTAYSFSVANGTTSTTVTATRADATATLQVQVNGGGFTALTSGTPSSALSLNVGANTVDVKVTAQNGTTTKTYTTTITRAASSNADLSALSFSAGSISPAFAAGTTAYSFSVANGTTSTTVTASRADANATLQVQINGGGFTALTSGTPSSALSLNVGANTVDVKVTAQDGSTIKTYTTTITRAGSANADLSALSFSAGSISPAFAAGTTAYSFSVANGTTSTTVTATRADANATLQVQVNGGGFNPLTSGSPSGNLGLNLGANTVDVKVTAQDGTTTKTYTTTITRQAAGADVSLALSGGNLTIDASGAPGATNVIIRFVTGAGGPFIEIFDPTRTLGAGSGMTQVNANTVRVPVASVTGAINLIGSNQADSFSLDFTNGDICPPGGIAVNGGLPNTPPGDSLIIDGDFSSGGTYGAGGPGAGTLTLDSGNVVTFTGLEPVDLSGATFPNFTVNVDPASTFSGNVTTTVAAVDGNVNTLVSFSSGLESVKLGTVTGTLTINGDNADNDYFLLNGVGTAMVGNLVVDGQGGNADVIDIHNATITLAAGKDLSLKADFIGLGRDSVPAPNDHPGVINVSGNITLEADGDSAITTPPTWGSSGVWGASIPSYFTPSALFTQRGSIQMRGDITKTAGADATATLKARAGVGFMNVGILAGSITSTSNKLNVVIDVDSDSNNDGSVQMQNFTSIVTNGGNLTIGGGADPTTGPAVGVSGGAATAGVLVNNANITTAGGNVSIIGKGFAGVTGFGVIFNASSSTAAAPTVSTDAGNITIIGTGGGTAGTNNSCPGVQLQGLTSPLKTVQLLTTTGAINVIGTASFGNNNGVNLLNTLTFAGSGAAPITLTGTATGTGTAISVSAAAANTIQLTSAGGNITFVGDTIALDAGAGTKTYQTSATGTITAKPLTVGRNINLGGADSATELGINLTELANSTAGTIAIGDGNSGAITVSQVIAPATFSTLALGTDASFSATGGLALDLTSATVYEKVTAAGNLTIDPAATLSVNPGAFVPAASDSFALITNLGTNPVSGTFASLPESTTVTLNGVNKTFTYLAGSGNDIALIPPVFAPTVTSTGATGPNAEAATMNGNVTSDGGSAITERGFVYAPTATDSDPNIGDAGVTKVIEGGTTTGAFSKLVNGLSPNTAYSFKAYAINSAGPGYSAVQSFSTTPAGPPAVNDGVTTGTGPSVVYPLANDGTKNTTITGVSNPAIIISADGRSLQVPQNFTGSFTYTTSAGDTATVDVTAGTPVATPRKYTGLLYDNAGALAGFASLSVSSRGSASVQVRVGTTTGRAVFSFKSTASTATTTTALGGVTLTRNADATIAIDLAATGGSLTGTLFPAPAILTPVKYHIALASIDDAVPGGGILRVTLTSRGQVRLVATLPDGRPISVGAGVTDNGTVIFYGKESSRVNPPGVIGGQLVPANLTLTDITGEILWKKPQQAPGSGGTQQAGVDTILAANGSIYAGALPPGMTNLAGTGTLTLSGGGFLVPEVNAVTLAGPIPTTPVGSVKSWAGVKADAGQFRIRVQVPGITKPVTGSGLYLPKSNSAWGYFPGTTLGGRVELTAP